MKFVLEENTSSIILRAMGTIYCSWYPKLPISCRCWPIWQVLPDGLLTDCRKSRRTFIKDDKNGVCADAGSVVHSQQGAERIL